MNGLHNGIHIHPINIYTPSEMIVEVETFNLRPQITSSSTFLADGGQFNK